jgi:acylphosphatase
MTSNNEQKVYVRARLYVYGQVQNVGFRQTAVKKAKSWDIYGWIRNRNDGRVEALIVGEKDNYQKMIDWMEEGPSAANVEKVEILSSEEINYNPFEEKLKVNPTI